MEVIPRKRPNVTWLNRSNKKQQEAGQIQDKNIAVKPRNNFIHLRKKRDFSDAVIWVEGVDFHVHRNILACCSDYFRALFMDTLQQSQNAQSQGHDGKTYAVSSKPKAPSSIEFSKSHCCPSLDKPTCLSSLPSEMDQNDVKRSLPSPITASQPSCQSGNRESKKGAGSRFEVSIEEISPATMNQILEYAYGGNVTILQDNVEQLLTAADRFQVPPLIHECCDFLIRQLSVDNCISIYKFASNFYDCFELRENASRYILDNFETVYQVMTAVVERQQEVIADIDITTFSPRIARDLMVLVGGSNLGFPLGRMDVFDCRTWGWSDIGPFGFAPRSYHGLTCLGNEMYIIGGFDGQIYLSSCCKLCTDTKNMKWESVTPMNTKRCYVGVAQLKDAIYAVGGYDGLNRLNSAEKFDANRNQWSFIEPMSHQRSDAGVAVINDKMYVCGGFSGTKCLSAMEMYDPDSQQWSPQPSMPQGRSGLGMVAHEGCLFAVGGFNGLDSTVRLSTMECYDPHTRQWTALTPMPHPRSNLAVAVLECTLYAIGGFNGDTTSRVVECYDFGTESWFQCARLDQNRSALSVCVISGLFNTASILGRGTNKHRRWSGQT